MIRRSPGPGQVPIPASDCFRLHTFKRPGSLFRALPSPRRLTHHGHHHAHSELQGPRSLIPSMTRLRTYTRAARQAFALLGAQIRLARKQHRMTAPDLATRAGISPTILQKIEKGGLSSEIGLVLVVAAIAGVPLFDPEPASLPAHRARVDAMLALLPQRVRRTIDNERIDDDFWRPHGPITGGPVQSRFSAGAAAGSGWTCPTGCLPSPGRRHRTGRPGR